jgi:hypothetical protein
MAQKVAAYSFRNMTSRKESSSTMRCICQMPYSSFLAMMGIDRKLGGTALVSVLFEIGKYAFVG